MLAAAITLTLFAFILTMVTDVIRRDGFKIIAALEGRSIASKPRQARPVAIRFSQPRKVAEQARWQTGLRAAA